MPLWKFRTLEEAEAHLDRLPTSPESSLGTALALLGLAEGARLGIRTAQRGLLRYRTVAEAEVERERFALDQLRDAQRQREIESSLGGAYEGRADELLEEVDDLVDDQPRSTD